MNYHFLFLFAGPFQKVLVRAIFFGIILFGAQETMLAQGDLLIFPKRLEFEDTRDRVKILNLHNKGKDTATYRISYIEYIMKEDGTFEKVQEPEQGQKFASPFLRYYPRSITLAPGETQVVKVQLIKTSDLQAGEYRSHLYFRAVPKVEEADKIKEQKSGKLKVNLVPVYGLSIANIIRVGDPKFEVSISDVSFKKIGDIPVLDLTFNRSGEYSCYGDIEIIYRSPLGTEVTVGEVQGLAVYTPGEKRKARIELTQSQEIDFNTVGGEFIVRYTSQGADKALIAETILKL